MYYPSFRKKGKVPILSGAEINTIAERYILDFDSSLLEEPKPIDIEAFLEFYLKVDMEFEYLSHDESILGMTVFNDTHKVPVFDVESGKAKYIDAHEGTVIIDNSLLKTDQEKRLRFTLGHETGHWVFHKGYYGYNPGQLSLFDMTENDTAFIRCRAINTNYLYKRRNNWDDEKWMEWHADKFSASILMPESSIQQVMAEFGNINKDNGKLVEAVTYISNVFIVSKQAAYYRLCDLNYVLATDETETNKQMSLFDD